MPVVGERRQTTASRQWQKDPLHAYAARFKEVADDILSESALNIFTESHKVYQTGAKRLLKDFFLEDAFDENDPSLTAYDREDRLAQLSEQFENDREACLEYAPAVDFNPVIGMANPIHKNLMMNCMFDKGAIPKDVAVSPKFTLSMETRILIDTDGNEIDMFKEQNKIKTAIDNTAPIKDTILTLPEMGTTNILADTFGMNDDQNLSIESSITSVLVNTYTKPGDTYFDVATGKDVVMAAGTTPEMKPAWFKVAPKKFVPNYGEYDRILMDSVSVNAKVFVGGAEQTKVVSAQLMGNTKKNRFNISATNPEILKVKLSTRVDTSSAMLKTCSSTWRVRTDIFEIPNAIPINIPLSPEEIKDISALYNVNQLTKLMSMMKLTLGNYKDDKIHEYLDNSFLTMDPNSKTQSTIDFAPRDGYMLDHIEWRHKTFMDLLDTQVTPLLQVLNDPNMTITVIGRADLIRKITPTEYSYATPSSIGPVELDYTKTVCTSDKRTYQFLSCDKMRGNNNLIVILNPRNSERIMYKIYDYQFYVSNEIRNAHNPALPAVHAFERWKFVEFQPVQSRIKVLNPSGLKTFVENDDPIGKSAMNDFEANKPEGFRK